MISDERLKELAQRMAEAMGMQEKRPALTVVQGGKGSEKQSGKPVVLHLVKPQPYRPQGGMDAVTRESHLRMIRTLKTSYRPFGVDLIVNQATIGKGSIEDLSDAELVQLHCDLERALDCIRHDVSFEDAGLLRPMEDVWCGTGG
jgi:hypothetical protein